MSDMAGLLDVAQGGAGRAFDDLLHLCLSLGELRLAVAAEGGAAFVLGDRLLQAPLPAFQGSDDLFELGEGLLEGELLDGGGAGSVPAAAVAGISTG
jgi:hypothetical protein